MKLKLNLKTLISTVNALYLVTLLFLIVSVLLYLQYRNENLEYLNRAKANIQRQVDSLAFIINQDLLKIEQDIDLIVNNLNRAGVPSQEELLSALKRIMYFNPAFVEAGVAYTPYSYNKKIRLYGISLTLEDKQLKQIKLDMKQDYTHPKIAWYNRAIREGALWLEPVFDPVRKKIITTYAVPLKQESKDTIRITGVFFLSVSLDLFWKKINRIDIGENGYSFMVSESNRYILHPDFSCLGKPANNNGPLKWAVFNKKRAGRISSWNIENQIFYRYTDGNSKQKYILYVKDIPVTNWKLGVTFSIIDYQINPTKSRRKYFLIILFAGIATFLVLAQVLGLYQKKANSLWKLSCLYSLFCFLILILILYLSRRFPSTINYDHQRVTHQYSLNQFILDDTKMSMDEGENPSFYIPTGILIQSVSFVNSNMVHLTGYIWQRYRKKVHDSISRGVIMPEGYNVEMEEVYRQQLRDYELIGWNFRVTLYEQFEYSQYPFMQDNIWIQLWHKEFYRNIILAPDIEAYQQTTPFAMPGLLRNIEIPEWELEQAYFSYRLKTYKSNFGFMDYSGLTNFPELFYNIHIKKEITGPLVTHIIPLLVINCMLFSILLLTNKENGKTQLLGYNTMNVITACAGFFLVVVFSHIDLREGFPAKGILYIEYYYFITYIIILTVALNSILYSLTHNKFIHYKNNKLMKVFFWPFMLTTMLLLTLNIFF